MSASHEPQPFFERYWQALLILFAVCCVITLGAYGPVIAFEENAHTSTPATHLSQNESR